MDVSRACRIPGWMEPEELRWLAVEAAAHQVIVELGSYMGRSTLALADTPGVVLAVDNWQGPPELASNPEDLFGKFVQHLGPEIHAGKVVPIHADHDSFTYPFADMVFIDGEHSYEAVKRAINTWKDVALLCGHDYRPQFPGVIQAVQESFPSFKVAPATTIWYVEGNGNTTRTT